MSRTLEIRLLGTLKVLREGRELEFPPSRKTRALLGYLVATGGAHTRQKLCDLLWEGPSDPRAALRWSLTKLRPLVDGEVTRLLTDGNRVSFECRGAHVDLYRIREEMPGESGDTTPGIELDEVDVGSLESAAVRFRGEFLEGLEISDCVRFDVWCSGEREKLRALREAILAELVRRLSDTPDRALPHARERLLVRPYSEAAHADLARILAACGREDEALEQLETARRILRGEMNRARFPLLDGVSGDLPPPARTGATARTPSTLSSPRAAGSGSAGPGSAGRDASSARPASGIRPGTAPLTAPDTPLVGREEERKVIRGLVDDAAAGRIDRAVLLTGDPGIGKTRLLTELVDHVRERGGEALVGRAYESERVRPHGVWIDALRSLPPPEIPPELRSELAALLPEISGAGAEDSDRNRLFDAVVRLLTLRAETEPVLAVVIDDLQWLDEASIALLHFAIRTAEGSGILFAAAARSVDLRESSAAARLVSTLRREDRLVQLDLSPLASAEIEQLVRDVGPELEAGRIFDESRGNPLFALEIARALREDETPLSDTLDGLIEDRFSRLGSRARETLPWIAALRRDFRPERLGRMIDVAPANLLPAVQELERHAILRVTESGKYTFSHELLREVAYRRTSRPARTLIHRQIARTLRDAEELEGEKAGELAHHAARGEEPALAARAYAAAGRHALSVFAWTEVAELAARGLEQAENVSDVERLPLRVDLLGLYGQLEMQSHRPPDLESRLVELIRELRSAGLHARIPSVHDMISGIHYGRGDFQRALERTLRGAQAGRTSEPATRARAIADTARCLGMLEREMDRAEALAMEAEEIARGLDEEIPAIPMALALVDRHAGRYEEAVRRFERAKRGSGERREVWFEWYCGAQLTMIEVERGRPEAALSRCRELHEVAAKLGEGSAAPFTRALEALARLASGEEGAGVRAGRAAEELRQIDSRWMLAWVQATAAAIDAAAGRPETARLRAEDARKAAATVDRRSESALARSVLARVALEAGEVGEAEEHLAAVREKMTAPRALSARARAAISDARSLLGRETRDVAAEG